MFHLLFSCKTALGSRAWRTPIPSTMRWSIYIFAIGTCKCCNLSQEHFPFFFILELYSEGKKKASAMLLMGDRVRNGMTRRPENGVSALNKQTGMLRSLSYSCSLSLISPYTSPARCLFTLSRWYFSYLTRPKKEKKDGGEKEARGIIIKAHDIRHWATRMKI